MVCFGLGSCNHQTTWNSRLMLDVGIGHGRIAEIHIIFKVRSPSALEAHLRSSTFHTRSLFFVSITLVWFRFPSLSRFMTCDNGPLLFSAGALDSQFGVSFFSLI